MKKVLKISVILLLFSVLAIPSQAQRRVVHYLPKYEQEPYHFGFLLAFNEMMYAVKTVENYQNIPQPADSWHPEPDPGYIYSYNEANTRALYVYNMETEMTPGFTVGIIGSKRLGRYFDLRFIPSLSFSERRMNYTIAVESNVETDENGNPKREIKPVFSRSIGTTFVEFPLNIKYRSKRYNNIGAYLMAGVNPKIDLASQKKNKLNINGQSIINNLVTKRFDCAAEIGTGFDIYNQWFKMGIEVKMSYGLLDIVKDDALIYTAPIDILRNKLFQVSLLFE